MAALLKMLGCTRKDPYDSSEDEEETKKFNPPKKEKVTSPRHSKNSKLKEKEDDNINNAPSESPSSPKTSPTIQPPIVQNPEPSIHDFEHEHYNLNQQSNPPDHVINESNKEAKDLDNLKAEAHKIEDNPRIHQRELSPVASPAPLLAPVQIPVPAPVSLKQEVKRDDDKKWEKLKHEKIQEDSNPSLKEEMKDENEDNKWERLRRERMMLDEEEQSA